MIVHRFFEPAIAQASYLIGCAATGEAIVIDPNRDIAKLFDGAQKALPPRRRRALDHKLRIWLESDGAHARGRPPAANVAIASTPAAKPAANGPPT